jgi:hypothetical protein
MNEEQIKAALARLLEIHGSVDEWDIAASATTFAERSLKRQISSQQDEILRWYNELTLRLLNLVGKDIGAQASELEKISEKISATEKNISKAQEILGAVSKVVGVAAAIAALATGA